MRLRLLAVLGVLVVVASGGCRRVDRFEPSYALELDDSLCGWHVLIDHADALWTEHGCENGSPIARRVRRLKPDELADLQAAIARLSRSSNTITQKQYAELHSLFGTLTNIPKYECYLDVVVAARDSDGTLREWIVDFCEESCSPNETDGCC